MLKIKQNNGTFKVKSTGRLQVGGSMRPVVPTETVVNNVDGSVTTTTLNSITNTTTTSVTYTNGNISAAVTNQTTGVSTVTYKTPNPGTDPVVYTVQYTTVISGADSNGHTTHTTSNHDGSVSVVVKDAGGNVVG